MKLYTPAILLTGLLSSVTLANSIDSDNPADNSLDHTFMEEVTIVGRQTREKQVTGAAQYIGPAELEQQTYSDIQRILRQAPGVSLQIEDGYGLRPNISIRGVATERSSRITLLEDNVLIAPAPYSAPSAYYFPIAGRMHAVEILKGPAAITQGPYTIGGAMNMISTPVPNQAAGSLIAEAAEDSTYRIHATYGNQLDNGWGFLIETHQWKSDGFQEIDRSGNDTGLDVKDYTAKLGYRGDRHSLELKLQYSRQDSNQSYLGLTDSDFDNDAFRRYGISALDNIHTRHEQQILRYQFEVSDAINISATAYNNEHERNWFKTEGIDLDGSTDAESLSRTSWSRILGAVNSGNSVNGFSADYLQDILDGFTDTAPGSIQIRSNAREYFSRGFQVITDFSFETGEVRHELQAGVRIHEDEEDRLQRNSSYHQEAGRLILDDTGLLGNAGNRIQEARAVSIYIQDRIELGNFILTPGVRFEDIEQKRTRWETRNDRTTNPASRQADNLRSTRSNDTSVLLPGLGVLYSLNSHATLVAGVHKGFTAPSNSPGVEEEKATNYELGLRYDNGLINTDVIYFLSDYENLLGECTASSGSDCTVGDAFNGDAATVQGVEFMFATTLDLPADFSLPVSLSYTFIDAEFDSDIADTDFFGDVSAGDPIPYIPEHQLNISLGLEKNRWSSYLSISYVDEVCVLASCGEFESTDDSLVLDLTSHFAINDKLTVYGKIENLTAEEDIMGRQPYGARPNKDRTVSLGLRVSF